MIGEVAAILTAVTWAAAAAFYKLGMSQADPVKANIARIYSTSLVMLVVHSLLYRFDSLFALPLYVVLFASLSGLTNLGLGDTLYLISIDSIGVARAVPISGIYPIFTIILAYFFLDEKVTLSIVLGAVVIILGLRLLTMKNSKNIRVKEKNFRRGVLAGLGAAVTWSIGIVSMNIALEEGDALAVNAIRTTVMAMVFLAAMPIIDRRREVFKISRRDWIYLTLGGVTALALGWTLFGISLQYIDAAKAVPLSSISPFFATLAGMILLKEKVSFKVVLGSALIVSGTLLTASA